MKEMDSTTWRRSGSSIVWSPELLGPLITTGEALPVRTVLCWMKDGFPDSPPGGGSTMLVGGLQTVLETADGADEAYDWLRANIMPLVRAVQSQWDRVGLVFGMDGPGKLFHHNEADDLVYFGRSRDRTKNIRITLGMWNGAATGEGAYKLIVPGTAEVGGYHVKRVS
ncbi:MAG: hypothetical protein V2A79_13935 [Planctomycetota bacterium]